MNAFPAHLCWAEATHAYTQGLAEGIPASPFGTGSTKRLPGIINRHFSEQLIRTETRKDRLEAKSTALLNEREHGSRGTLLCSEEGGISHGSA